MHKASDSRVLLINITGHDKTGVTHSLTRVLAEFGARILDIGQAVIHDALTLGILVELTDEMRSCPVMTELLLRAHEVGVQVRFTAVSAEEYQRLRSLDRRAMHVSELIADELAALDSVEIPTEAARYNDEAV